MSEINPPAIRFVDDARRREAVALDWPLEVDGRVVVEIVVRRPSTQEVAAFVERVLAVPEGPERNRMIWPIYSEPEAVIDALDPDDFERVMEVSNRFLPRRFRVDPAS